MILLCGNYGGVNVGDECILRAFIQRIKVLFPREELVVMSYNPEQTSRVFGVRSVLLLPFGLRSFFRGISQWNVFQTLKAYTSCKVFILGGGGLFTDENFFAVFLWAFHVFVAFLFRKPVYFYGQSIGPLNTFFTRFILKRLFRFISFFSVRDRESKELLRVLGVQGHVDVAPDPIFSLTSDQSILKDAFQNISFQYGLKNKSYVVVVLRPWIKKVSNFENIMARIVDHLYLKNGLKFIFVPFQIFREDDRSTLNKVFTHIKNKKSVQFFVFSPHSSDYYKLFSLFQHAHFIIGMRLHSLMLSSLFSVPYIPLMYSSKVKSFVDTTPMKNFGIPLEKLTYEILESHVSEINLHYDHYRTSLSQAMPILQNQSLEGFDRLFSRISS